VLILSPRHTDDLIDSSSTSYDTSYPSFEREALFSNFEAFINRASTCRNVFATANDSESITDGFQVPRSQSSQASALDTSSQPTKSSPKRQIILLEELPNILHIGTQAKFHAVLQSLVLSPPSQPPVPVVVIVSDAGMRGEASDERLETGKGWSKDRNGVVDIRTVLSRDLLNGPHVTQIRYESLIKLPMPSQHFCFSSVVLTQLRRPSF
jgi:cell cycle checkpoint protein